MTDTFYPLLRHPRDFYRNFYIAVEVADWFNDIENSQVRQIDSESRGYEMFDLPKFAEYVEAMGSDARLSEDWQLPYPNQAQSYAELSPICSQELNSAVSLLACEAEIVIISENQDKIPPSSLKFIQEEFQIRRPNPAFYGVIGSHTDAELDDFAASIPLSVSPTKYDNWEIEPFSQGTLYLAAKSDFYHRVSSERLEQLETQLVDAGWEKGEQTPKVKDTTFEAEKYGQRFTKTRGITEAELVLLVFDTSTMNTDCIAPADPENPDEPDYSRNNFCDDDALFKDSGFFVQLAVAESGIY
jgi:hypothetical protein